MRNSGDNGSPRAFAQGTKVRHLKEETAKPKTKEPRVLLPMIWPESVRMERRKTVEIRGRSKCVVEWINGMAKQNTIRSLERHRES